MAEIKLKDRVKVKGTSKTGVVTKTRLLSAHQTGQGTHGHVRMFTVRFDDNTEMEYEWTELQKI